MKLCNECEDVLVTIVDGVFSGSEICLTCTRGEWKITKFWDTITIDVGEYKQGWNYEVAYWVNDDVMHEEYFENKEEAEDYLQECIKEEK